MIKLLKYFTYLPLDHIAGLEKLVGLVMLSNSTSGRPFGEEIAGLSDADLSSIFADVPSTTITNDLLNAGVELLNTLCDTGLCQSRGAAKKMIKSGGVYLNNVRIDNIDYKLTPDSLASDTIIVLRTGKKKYHLIKVN